MNKTTLSTAVIAIFMSISAASYAETATPAPNTKHAITAEPLTASAPLSKNATKKEIMTKIADYELKHQELEANYINSEADLQDYNINEVKQDMAALKNIIKNQSKSKVVTQKATAVLEQYQNLLDQIENTLNKE